MKRILYLIAALLLCSPAHSQEADKSGSSAAELKAIARFDLNPSYSFSDSETYLSFGNTIFCTTFEGHASEHFSWFICNQWLSETGEGVRFERFKEFDWLSYCYADITFGNWTFTLGKDFISTGGFELNDWDWDIYAPLASPFSDGLDCYQWGGRLSYTTTSENNTFSLQMVSSPYSVRPFSDGLKSISAQWKSEYDRFATLWSYSALEREKGVFDHALALGQQLYLGDWTLTLDYFNNVGFYDEDRDGRLASGGTYQAAVQYATDGKFDISLRGMYISSDKEDILPSSYRTGVLARWYFPKGLRLHTLACYDSLAGSVCLLVGAKCDLFSIKLW